MSGVKSCSAAAVLLLVFGTSWSSSNEQQHPPVMVLSTADGSRLTAVVDTESLPLAASHATMELPMAEIEAIRFGEDRSLGRVFLANGDRLSGRIQAERVELRTALGRASVPWAEIAITR